MKKRKTFTFICNTWGDVKRIIDQLAGITKEETITIENAFNACYILEVKSYDTNGILKHMLIKHNEENEKYSD